MTSVPQAEKFRVDLDPGATLDAYVRQRRRFATSVASLDDVTLAAATRCHLWSVADVLRHLADVDVWMTALWNGKSPPFTSFDPNVTPHEQVVIGRSMSDIEARDRYLDSTRSFLDDIEASSPDRYAAFGVSPLGVVPWWMSVLHISWDSWLHERDVFIPLGRDIETPGDEVRPVLVYGLLLASTFITEADEFEIAGVRLTTGGTWSLTPIASPDEHAPTLVDVLAGRGELDEAFGSFDARTVERLDGAARSLRPA